jgi:hypothetical protein
MTRWRCEDARRSAPAFASATFGPRSGRRCQPSLTTLSTPGKKNQFRKRIKLIRKAYRRGGPERMRARTSSSEVRHGSGDSNHHVAPAAMNGATISASAERDFPGVRPECTTSNGASLVRWFRMNAIPPASVRAFSAPRGLRLSERRRRSAPRVGMAAGAATFPPARLECAAVPALVGTGWL